MQKKLFILFLLTGGFSLIDACCGGDDSPYFDFDSLTLSNAVGSSPGLGTTIVEIAVSPAGLRFFADGSAPLQFKPTERLYGQNCPDPGHEGLKNRVVDVEITANENFNDTLPAGSSLKSLFLWNYLGNVFNKFPLSPIEFEAAGIFPLILQTQVKPKTLGIPYLFNITLTQEDGKKTTATTLPITFE